MLVDESILNGLDLSGYDREYRDIDTIELIKAAPGTTLAQTRVDLPHSLHTVTTVGMYRDSSSSSSSRLQQLLLCSQLCPTLFSMSTVFHSRVQQISSTL